MFEIIQPLSDTQYLVAARVPQHPPPFILTIQQKLAMNKNVTTRRYRFPYVPSGFWARLITRILIYERENLMTYTEVSLDVIPE